MSVLSSELVLNLTCEHLNALLKPDSYIFLSIMLSQILHDDLYNMVVNVTSQNDTQYLLELAHFKDANDAFKFVAVSTRTI